MQLYTCERMATEVAANTLGEEGKGYVVRMGGGNGKQGFPMAMAEFATESGAFLL